MPGREWVGQSLIRSRIERCHITSGLDETCIQGRGDGSPVHGGTDKDQFLATVAPDLAPDCV